MLGSKPQDLMQTARNKIERGEAPMAKTKPRARDADATKARILAAANEPARLSTLLEQLAVDDIHRRAGGSIRQAEVLAHRRVATLAAEA